MRLEKPHLDKLKIQLHQNAMEFYGFNPFTTKTNERQYVQIRQCFAYVLNSYNDSERTYYSLTDIGYLIDKDHSTVIYSIKTIEDWGTSFNLDSNRMKLRYDDINSILNNVYAIVGNTMNGSEIRLNKAKRIIKKIDDNVKLTTDQQFTWELCKNVIIQNIKTI